MQTSSLFPLLFFVVVTGAQARTQTVTSVSAAPSSPIFGQTVTLTAAVRPQSATGKVTFYDGVNVLGSATLSNGAASLVTISIGYGNRSLTATYGGDSNYAPSLSTALTVTIPTKPGGGLVPTTGTNSTLYEVYPAALADLNHDNNLDLVATVSNGNSSGPATVFVFLGNGDGTFQAPQSYLPGTSAVGVAVADIDMDGNPDLVVAESGGLTTLIGNGDGTFHAGSTVLSASDLSVVRVADVNGDGLPDLVLLRGAMPGVEILLGNGDGTFQINSPIEINLNGFQYDLLVADFNGDGIPDLATANPNQNTVSVMLGTGGATFQAPVLYTSYGAQYLAVGDINQDGKTDLLVGNVNTATFDLLLGNGDGTLAPAQTLASEVSSEASGSLSITVYDFDGDGHPDVLSVQDNYGVSVVLGNGDGTFRPPLVFPLFRLEAPLVYGDLNHDGIVDIVAALPYGPFQPYLGKLAPVFTVSASPNPANVGQSFTITVTSSYPDATGSISLRGAAPSGTATLINGGATFTFSNPPTTIYYIEGTYSGDSKYAATVLPTLVVPVQQAVSAALSVSPNPALPGQVITLNATVNSPYQELASFYDGATPFCRQTAYQNAATCQTTLSAGRHVLTVVFPGGDGVLPASAIAIEDVKAAPNGQLISGGTFNASPTPTAILVADLNADGFLDFAVLDPGSSSITVYLGNGQGDFQSPLQNVLAFVPGAMVTGQFSGYNNIELAVTDPADNAVAIIGYYNPYSEGPIQATILVGTQPLAVATADFNGDGYADLVTANAGSNDVSLLLAVSGGGAFRHVVSLPAGRHPIAVVAADFNNDGKADFAVANRDDGTVMVFLGNGDGTFQAPVVTSAGSGPIAIVAGDLNGDGKPDLVVVDGGSNQLTVLLGNGDGSFRTSASYSTGSAPSSAVLVDLNGDEKLDLAVTTSAGLLVFTGNGNGTFGARASYPQYAGAAWVSAGAFSGNGRMDLLISLPQSGSVALMVNGTPTNTTLSIAPAATTMSGNMTLTATVSPAVSAGAVSFYDGTTQIGASPVSSGSGSFSTTLLFPGAHSLSARFTGGSGYGSSASSPVSLQVSPVPATGLSAPIRQTFSSNSPVNLTPGDFNKDGIEDFAFWRSGNGLVVILGNGDGTFRYPPPGTGTAFGGNSPVTADFNNDGNTDIGYVEIGVAVAFGDGTGNFNQVSEGSGPTFQTALAAGDFNGDGRVDIVTLDSSNPSVYVQLGIGDGTFQYYRNFSAGANPTLVAIGDFNEDGRPDIVVVNDLSSASTGVTTAGEVDILLGNGDGTFAPARRAAIGAQPVSMVVADFNGDGRADVALVHTGTNMLSVLLGNGDGEFAPPATYQLGATPAQLLAADMDGDGHTDLVVMFTSASPAFAVLYGAGDGTFGNPVNYPDILAPSAMAVGDVNGDGRMDVILAEGDTVNVFLGAVGSLSIVQGSAQATAVGTPFAVALAVNAPPGAQVTFTAPNGTGSGGSFPGGATAVTVTANASGVATAPAFTANTDPGSYNVLVWAQGVGGFLSFPLTNKPGPPASLNAATGSGQTAIVNTAFNSLLQATVQDGYGNGIPNMTVTFTAPGAGASCTFSSGGTTATTVTTSVGIATIELGQANGVTGSYSVVASIAGLSTTATFSLTNQAAPTISVVSGANQSAILNASFAAPLVAKVVDASGHPVQYTAVMFTAPISGASAMFAASGGNSVLSGTDQNGVASALLLSAAGATGSFAVTATVTAYGSSVTFPLTNTATPPGQPEPQSISFPPIPNHSANDPPFTLTATASSGLPVSFSVVSGPGSLNGGTLSITGPGYVLVQAAQAGNTSYSAASPVNQLFLVNAVPAALTVTKSHLGSFAQNQSGVTYTIAVGNAAAAGPTSQTVTVTETPPAGLTVTSMSGGATWNCVVPWCSTSTVLNAGSSYPSITVTANVAGNASPMLTNQAMVSYGVSTTTLMASDPATIVPFTCAISGGQTASITDVQMIVNEALGAVPAVHDLTHDGVVNVADIEKVINAALDQGCPY